MANTTKPSSKLDFEQNIQHAYNDVNASITSDGFLVGEIGRKIEMTITTTNVADDTEVYNFSEAAGALYEITVVYTDATRETLMSAERTA